MWKYLPAKPTFQDVINDYKSPEQHSIVPLTNESDQYTSMIAVHETSGGWRKHAINRVPDTD